MISIGRLLSRRPMPDHVPPKFSYDEARLVYARACTITFRINRYSKSDRPAIIEHINKLHRLWVKIWRMLSEAEQLEFARKSRLGHDPEVLERLRRGEDPWPGWLEDWLEEIPGNRRARLGHGRRWG